MGATPRITTTRLTLDPIRATDAAEMAEVLADEALYVFIGGTPPTAAELEARYRDWLLGAPRAGEAWHNWVIRRGDGVAIGHLQATVTDDGGGRAADIAWVVGTEWQGQGFASEAAAALGDWLGTQDVGSVTAHVHPENRASARVAENAGLAATDEVVDGEVVWRREIRAAPEPA